MKLGKCVEVIAHDQSKWDYDLQKVVECGQFFSYHSFTIDSENGAPCSAYQLISGDRMCFVWQMSEPDWEHTNIVGTFWFAGKPEGFRCYRTLKDEGGPAFWGKMLNVDFAPSPEFEDIMRSNPFLTEARSIGAGIAIMRRDPWETLIDFIISQRNNIGRIRRCVELLRIARGFEVFCDRRMWEVTFGEAGLKYYDHNLWAEYWYSYPKAEDVDVDNLWPCHLGFREQYVAGAVQMVRDGRLILDDLRCGSEAVGASFNQAMFELQKLRGVGNKVANCVALFGLGYDEAFPVDIWIERAMDYCGLPFSDVLRWGKDAGLIQQYLYYYIKTKL